MSDQIKIDELNRVVIAQQKRIEDLENIIDEKIAKAIFHQTKSIQHRIDQFLFDAKIALKNSDSDFFNSLESLSKRHLDEY
ncbi:MAG: hypothetical protein RBR59_03995 [Sulfurimonadaceae bacterium]|jgi:hypothetical protein|nr:hypothetical protein [Sulfurimonadaceae bacterium]